MEKFEFPKVAQSHNTRGGKHKIWNVEYRHGIDIVYFIQEVFQKLPRESKWARSY